MKPDNRPLEAGFERILTVVRIVLGTLMLTSIAVNFANVVARRVFSAPFAWAEEAMIYIMVWLVFLGAVLVSWDRAHLKMDLLSAALRGRWRLSVNMLAVAVVLAVSVYVVVHSVPVVLTFARNEQVSVAAGIPMAIPHAAITIGFGLMLIAVLIRFRRHVAGIPGGLDPGASDGGAGPGEDDPKSSDRSEP